MDKELFELCKSVYEKTGWETSQTIAAHENSEDDLTVVASDSTYLGHNIYRVAYLYTSDFLINKIHKSLFRNGKRRTISFIFEEDGSISVDCDDIHHGPRLNVENGAVINIALLKQVLALHDAGELK